MVPMPPHPTSKQLALATAGEASIFPHTRTQTMSLRWLSSGWLYLALGKHEVLSGARVYLLSSVTIVRGLAVLCKSDPECYLCSWARKHEPCPSCGDDSNQKQCIPNLVLLSRNLMAHVCYGCRAGSTTNSEPGPTCLVANACRAPPECPTFRRHCHARSRFISERQGHHCR